jgi:type IV secretory pathway VirB3-like protein
MQAKKLLIVKNMMVLLIQLIVLSVNQATFLHEQNVNKESIRHQY